MITERVNLSQRQGTGMATPCENEDTIKGTKMKVDSIGKNIDRLCESNARLADEMREMNQTLISHMVSNREYALKIETVEKAVDVLFVRSRRLEDIEVPLLRDRVNKIENTADGLPQRVKELEDWQNRMRGALIVFPAICTGISMLCAVFALYISIR